MNGNTTWGTAQPNGKVKVDQWLDGSSAPAFASAGVLTGANIVPVPNSLQADVGGVAGTDDFVYAKNTQSDGVVLGNHVATPTRLTFTAPGTSGQSQVFTVLVWKSASIVGTSQNGVEEVSKPIFVAGTPAATGSQTAPTDSQIRSALGATPNDFIGTIADITIANGQTVLLMSNINRRQSMIPSQNIDLKPQPFGVLFGGQNTVIGGTAGGTVSFTNNTFRGGFTQSGNDLVIPQDGWYEVSGGTEATDGAVTNPWTVFITSTQYGRITPEKYVAYPNRGVGTTTNGTAYLLAGDHIRLNVWNTQSGNIRYGQIPDAGRTIYVSFLSAKMI